MKPHRTTRKNRVIMAIIIFLFTGIYSCTAQGQPRYRAIKHFKSFSYVGLESSFGTRSFRINSNIPEVNKMPVVEQGGSLGFILGNEFVRAKIRVAGFYYTAASVPRTIDLFESEALFNFYPIQLFSSEPRAFDVYVSGGISLDILKFYGNYLQKDNQPINYSDYKEPYLGKLSQVNATVAFGVEYHLPYEFDFVHVFAEAKYGSPIQSIVDREAFKGTSIKSFTSISIGVGFGMYR